MKLTSNLLLLTNNKDYNDKSQLLDKPRINPESSLGMIHSDRRRGNSQIDHYPVDISSAIPFGGSSKKVVYQVQPRIAERKQISLKTFNDMKLQQQDVHSQLKFQSMHNSPREQQSNADLMTQDFDKDWKISDKIKQRRDSFQRRL